MSEVAAKIIYDKPRVSIEMPAEHAAFLYTLMINVRMTDIPEDLYDAFMDVFGETGYYECLNYVKVDDDPDGFMIVRGPGYEAQIGAYLNQIKEL